MKESAAQRMLRVWKRDGLAGFVRKGWQTATRALVQAIFYPYARWRIPRSAGLNTAEEIVSFIYHKLGGVLRPEQVKSEIAALAKIVERLRPRVVLEIGTQGGGTLFVFSRLAAKDATIVSIDLPPKAPLFSKRLSWEDSFYRKFAAPGQTIHLIRGDSHDPATLVRLKNILGDRKIDFLFIDGDHSYKGVNQDYKMYSPLVSGVIGFHDIAHHPSAEAGVERFWNEIKAGKRYQEFVEDKNQGWGGIGVLFVGPR